MPNTNSVTYRATVPLDDPATTTYIHFHINPTVSTLYIADVFINLNTNPNPPPVLGRIRTGTAGDGNGSQVTIFVDQSHFDQLTSCLGGSAVDLTIEYDNTKAITNVFGHAEALRALLFKLEKKIDHLTDNLLKKDRERPPHYPSDISELGGEKKVVNR